MEDDYAEIAVSLQQVRDRIARAAARANRDPNAITLVAVSKTKEAGMVEAAYRAGQRHFGENYAQELVDKADALAGKLDDMNWHFIGHLQTNKARFVAQRALMVHTVDSVRLAGELARRAAQDRPTRLQVLIEVNVGDESTKSGVAPDQVGAIATAIAGHESLWLRGLMCIPPNSDDPEVSRDGFRLLRQLQQKHGGPEQLPVLSMGMTHDLEVAIEEGATLVRVGTAIFGARSPAPKR